MGLLTPGSGGARLEIWVLCGMSGRVCETELESTNSGCAGLNIDKDAFVVLKPAGVVGGCSCH